jgi:predicted nucleic-acid-binding protein
MESHRFLSQRDSYFLNETADVYTPVLGIRVPMVSPVQILHDLTDCVTTVNTKVSKRLKRLRVACLCLSINPDVYIAELVIAKEKGVDLPIQDFIEYLERPPGKHEDGLFEMKNQDYDDSVKKGVESILTAQLNSDLTLYYATCEIAHNIVNRIIHHSIFGPLFDDKRIIFIHKGGIAQRISLLSKFPHYKKEIEEAFNLGGDNDCNIIVDPQLPGYEDIRTLLVNYVHHCMIEFVKPLSDGIAETRAKTITKVDICSGDEKLTVPVTNIQRNNFKLYKNGDVSFLDIDVIKNGVYVTSNDTLCFTDEIGRRCHFTLMRYKKAFQVGNRHVGAELLDIAIPHRDESKAYENFHHYYSGQWINFVNI